MLIVKRWFIVIGLFFSLISFSQEKLKLPRFDIRGSVDIPRNISSSAYRVSFLGVYDASIGFNYRLFSNFGFGLGYNGSLFNNSSSYKNIGLSTKLSINNGFFRLGYDDMFASGKGFWSVSLYTGYGVNQYTNVVCEVDTLNGKRPTQFNGAYISPEISVSFLVEENFAFGVNLSYHHCLYEYDPAFNCFDSHTDYNRSTKTLSLNNKKYGNKANMGWISFGFNFYYGFKRKAASGG